MAIQEDRLDRVERILAQVAESQKQLAERQVASDERLSRIEKIAESNARSNLANSEAITETRRDQALLRSELREFISIVREYVEVTNRRLNALEDKQ